MEKVQLEILVKGRVQNVFFRMYTQLKARELGIIGYVQNTLDGDVKILGSGNKDDMNKFVEWCHHGSPYSKVTKVITSDLLTSQSFQDFTIRH
jgi:acylphosphatase